MFTFLLTGCVSVSTTHPIIDPKQHTLDEKLTGIWAPKNYDKVLEKHPTNYFIKIATYEDGTASLETLEWSRKSARLRRHQTFHLACAPLEGGPVCMVVAPKRAVDIFSHDHRRIPEDAPYLFARYEMHDADEVTVYYLSMNAIQAEIKAGRLEGREYGPVAILYLPPASLRDLVRERPELFVAKGEVFQRIEESVFNALFVSNGHAGTAADASTAELTTLMGQVRNGSLKMQSVYVAIEKIGKLGKSAEPAVPLLTEVLWQGLLSDDYRVTNSAKAASIALMKIGTVSPETLRALEYMIAETSDRDLKKQASKTFKKLLAIQWRTQHGRIKDNAGTSGGQ